MCNKQVNLGTSVAIDGIIVNMKFKMLHRMMPLPYVFSVQH